MIDKWERELAQGLEPDLMEGLSTEARRKEEAAWEKLRQANKPPLAELENLEGFEESYG